MAAQNESNALSACPPRDGHGRIDAFRVAELLRNDDVP
jgi:hypothetical protein